MRFANPLVLVEDLDASVAFYARLLGAQPRERAGDFALFTGGLGLHRRGPFLDSAFGSAAAEGRGGTSGVALYFEADDLDDEWERLRSVADVVHAPRVEPWGGRIFRLRDPEGHVVEVGEAG